MVHRVKDLSSPPSALVHSKWNNLRALVLSEGDLHDAKTECYRDCTLEELTKLYGQKCAYCERYRGDEVQVDHYRPKRSRNHTTKTKYNHTGYYWLAYEWSNLIPLCSKCNQAKSNKFPLSGWTNTKRISYHLNTPGIAGFNAYDLEWLNSYEQPLLINPELELNPEKHIAFTSHGNAIPKTDEGAETIEICQLNRRDLVRNRLLIIQGYVDKIKIVFDDFALDQDIAVLKGALRNIFREIKRNCHIDAEFSLFHLYVYKYFDYFVDSKLPLNIRGQALRYFNEFNKKHII